MTVATPEAAPRRFFAIAAAALTLALWLVTRPYPGIIHDSRLYTLQALGRLDPAGIGADLFLAYGSQDKFSVISALYAPAIAALGLATANITLLLVAQAAWLAAVFLLARTWLPGRDSAIAGLVCAIVFPGTFVGMFRYGEAFFTARLPSEALVIVGIAALLAGRRTLSAALLVAAALFHPLTALPGITLAILHEGRSRPRVWWLAGIAVTAGIGLAVFGVAPFSQLLQRYDAAWLETVRLRNAYCFIAEWRLVEWLNFATIVGSAALAWVFGPVATHRLLLAAIATATLGMVTTAVGADLLDNVLITGLQTWRWLWLLALVAHIALAPVLLGLLRGQSTMHPNIRMLFLIALGGLFLGQFIGSVTLVAPVFSAAAILVNHWARRGQPVPLPLRLLGLVTLALVAAITQFALFAWVTSPNQDSLAWQRVAVGLVISSAALAGFGLLFKPRPHPPALAGLGLIIVLAAAAAWDQRTPWRRFIDATVPAPATVTAALAGPGQAYWEGDLTPIWLMLRQPNFFSCDQGGGVLFSRATAIAYADRRQAFRRFGVRELEGRFCADAADHRRVPPPRTRASLDALCRDQPGLGALMLLSPVAGVPARVWDSPVEYRDLRGPEAFQPVIATSRFFAYRCADFRTAGLPD